MIPSVDDMIGRYSNSDDVASQIEIETQNLFRLQQDYSDLETQYNDGRGSRLSHSGVDDLRNLHLFQESLPLLDMDMFESSMLPTRIYVTSWNYCDAGPSGLQQRN
ncbi:hypothetical protein QAD02_015487, partial [Eretmocerus hayati]